MRQFSSGWSRAGQALVLGSFTLFWAGIALLVYDNLDGGKGVFLAAILGLGVGVGKNALDFHDVYLAEKTTFVLKHLFYTRRLAAGEVRSIRSGLLPGSFYLVTAQRNFYFYFVTLSSLATELTSLQADTTLQALNQKLRQLQQAA
jgi:hypothetical protein